MTSEKRAEIFERLYLKKFEDVKFFCQRYVSPHEAEELAQEIFINVFNSLNTFRGESHLNTWLYAITRNHCNNYFRYKHTKKRYAPEVSMDHIREVASEEWKSGGVDLGLLEDKNSENPLEMAEQAEEIETIVRGIDKLTPKERTCVLIFANNRGISYKEVAGRLEIPINTVRSRLSRSRANLRKKIDHIKTINRLRERTAL
jgi:RNA polymerase sigma-70 factor (ECF subfamily)